MPRPGCCSRSRLQPSPLAGSRGSQLPSPHPGGGRTPRRGGGRGDRGDRGPPARSYRRGGWQVEPAPAPARHRSSSSFLLPRLPPGRPSPGAMRAWPRRSGAAMPQPARSRCRPLPRRVCDGGRGAIPEQSSAPSEARSSPPGSSWSATAVRPGTRSTRCSASGARRSIRCGSNCRRFRASCRSGRPTPRCRRLHCRCPGGPSRSKAAPWHPVRRLRAPGRVRSVRLEIRRRFHPPQARPPARRRTTPLPGRRLKTGDHDSGATSSPSRLVPSTSLDGYSSSGLAMVARKSR